MNQRVINLQWNKKDGAVKKKIRARKEQERQDKRIYIHKVFFLKDFKSFYVVFC